MNSLDALIRLNKNRNKVLQNVGTIRKLGEDFNKAECEYKKALHRAMRQLRDADDVAWTTLERFAQGVPEVADAKYERDHYRTQYFSYVRENKALSLEIEIQAKELERDYLFKRQKT